MQGKTQSISFDGREIRLTTGRFAPQAGGSVLVECGDTAVLGGLKSKTESETITKLPYLGDIPLLGYLFKNQVKQETMSTLLVFIKPKIIRSPEDMTASMRKVLEERMRDHRSVIGQTRDAIFGQ